jgi:hypothetical protein
VAIETYGAVVIVALPEQLATVIWSTLAVVTFCKAGVLGMVGVATVRF